MNWFQKLMCKWFNVGCPDGGDGGGGTTPPVPGGGSRPGILMCYYGTQDGQMVSTGAHVNAAHIGSWGDWVTPAGRAGLTEWIINYAKDAVNNGVNKLIFTLDWCLYTQTNPRHRLADDVAVDYLIKFCDRIREEGLMGKVVGWYTIDEPNIPEINLSADDVRWGNQRARDVTRHYTNGGPAVCMPLGVIYGERSSGTYPGIDSYDWCGIDNYGNDIFNNGMYNRLVSQLRADQKTIIVPGGSNPWREDPVPYYNHAQTDMRVAMIMPFAWFPDPDGIGFNGMQPQYNAVGDKIKAANP